MANNISSVFPWRQTQRFIAENRDCFLQRGTKFIIGIKDDDLNPNFESIASLHFKLLTNPDSKLNTIVITGICKPQGLYFEGSQSRIELNPDEENGTITLPNGFGKIFLRPSNCKYRGDIANNPEAEHMADKYIRNFWLALNHIVGGRNPEILEGLHSKTGYSNIKLPALALIKQLED